MNSAESDLMFLKGEAIFVALVFQLVFFFYSALVFRLLGEAVSSISSGQLWQARQDIWSIVFSCFIRVCWFYGCNGAEE